MVNKAGSGLRGLAAVTCGMEGGGKTIIDLWVPSSALLGVAARLMHRPGALSCARCACVPQTDAPPAQGSQSRSGGVLRAQLLVLVEPSRFKVLGCGLLPSSVGNGRIMCGIVRGGGGGGRGGGSARDCRRSLSPSASGRPFWMFANKTGGREWGRPFD